jgi:hypothetical protein
MQQHVANNGYDLPKALGLQLLALRHVIRVPDVVPLPPLAARLGCQAAPWSFGNYPAEGGEAFAEVAAARVDAPGEGAGESQGGVAATVEEDDCVGVGDCGVESDCLERCGCHDVSDL